MNKFFQEGNRKLVMTLIGVAMTIAMEKFGSGMSDNMKEVIISLIAIFAGSNVAEHFANALKIKYDARLPVVENMTAQAEELPPPAGPSVQQVAQYAQQIAKDSTARFQAIEQLLAKQATSIQGLVTHINNGKKQPQQDDV